MGAGRTSMVRNIPNILSVFRLLLVPLTIWLILEHDLALAFVVFVVAGVTDAVDGTLARWLDARTPLGAFLDPLADKALLVSVYITLGLAGYLPSWVVILVVFRDALIVGGAILYHVVIGPLHMQPLFVSKTNTVAQVVLAAATLAVEGLNMDVGPALGVLTWVTAATTAASGAAYLWVWGRKVASDGQEG